jgi:hypothetical protein
MLRLAQFSLLLAVSVFAVGCNDSGAKTDGGADGSGVDGPPSCPAQLPSVGTACSGSTVCEYGQATCCGITHSFMTCTCSSGTFDCVMTVECNFVCPDAGGGG